MAVLTGWLAFVVGAIIALGWGYGLMAGGAATVLLAALLLEV